MRSKYHIKYFLRMRGCACCFKKFVKSWYFPHIHIFIYTYNTIVCIFWTLQFIGTIHLYTFYLCVQHDYTHFLNPTIYWYNRVVHILFMCTTWLYTFFYYKIIIEVDEGHTPQHLYYGGVPGCWRYKRRKVVSNFGLRIPWSLLKCCLSPRTSMIKIF